MAAPKNSVTLVTGATGNVGRHVVSGLLEAFGDAAFADGALDAWSAFVEQPERVTSTVQEVTGSPARTFAEWALDHAEDFR